MNAIAEGDATQPDSGRGQESEAGTGSPSAVADAATDDSEASLGPGRHRNRLAGRRRTRSQTISENAEGTGIDLNRERVVGERNRPIAPRPIH